MTSPPEALSGVATTRLRRESGGCHSSVLDRLAARSDFMSGPRRAAGSGQLAGDRRRGRTERRLCAAEVDLDMPVRAPLGAAWTAAPPKQTRDDESPHFWLNACQMVAPTTTDADGSPQDRARRRIRRAPSDRPTPKPRCRPRCEAQPHAPYRGGPTSSSSTSPLRWPAFGPAAGEGRGIIRGCSLPMIADRPSQLDNRWHA